MLEIIVDIVALLMAIAGIAGCVVPALPGPPISFAALLLLYIANNPNNEITGKFLIIWIAIVAVVSILDYVIQPYFTKITGGSKLAVRYSIAGMVAGMVFFPPFGIIIGSFLGALIAELFVNKKPLQNSLLAAFGAFLGFIFGTGLKLAASVTMLYYTIRFIFF
ncbi:MAG: DUF456 domain-containing protein [Bacteroidales bacterium]|nr:DUF456 domain-containing protein [Bacteroidales bacterium]MBO7268949.1 DUF456 domain-containing protein [Bacteroidales bacterium]